MQKKIAAKRIAIIYVQLPHTDEEYNELIIPGLKAAGVTDILVERYQMGLNDFRSSALRVRSFRPDMLILSGFPPNYVTMVKALREQNLIKDGNTVASYDFLDAARLLPAEAVEGVRVSAPLFVSRKDEEPGLKDWYARFEERYRKLPLYTNAYAYDMASIIIDAARRQEAARGKKSLTQLLQETRLDGITGELRFDENGDLPAAVELAVFRNGVPVPDR